MTCGTPKLTTPQFYIFRIDRYVKQEVTITVILQQYLITLVDIPSCGCREAPIDGTILL